MKLTPKALRLTALATLLGASCASFAGLSITVPAVIPANATSAKPVEVYEDENMDEVAGQIAAAAARIDRAKTLEAQKAAYAAKVAPAAPAAPAVAAAPVIVAAPVAPTAPVAVPAATTAAAALAVSPVASVAPVAPSVASDVKNWSILVSDGRLATTLERWTKMNGMKLIWDAPHHVNLSTSDTFRGTFAEAVTRVLSSPAIKKSSFPLEACIYPNNPPVLRVTPMGEQADSCPQ